MPIYFRDGRMFKIRTVAKKLFYVIHVILFSNIHAQFNDEEKFQLIVGTCYFNRTHLSAEELCQQSGLTSENLKKLEEARLLVPDTKDGRYRPKLAGWGKKLAYLLSDGWGIEEIQRWSKERWESGNPREFPPKGSNYDK